MEADLDNDIQSVVNFGQKTNVNYKPVTNKLLFFIILEKLPRLPICFADSSLRKSNTFFLFSLMNINCEVNEYFSLMNINYIEVISRSFDKNVCCLCHAKQLF